VAKKPERITLRAWLDLQQEKDKSKTQDWLAGEIGISSPFLSQILSGQRTPSLNTAARIEELTGIPAREFAEVAS
jgi:transcriptional regulator with XRE-family HTH domain